VGADGAGKEGCIEPSQVFVFPPFRPQRPEIAKFEGGISNWALSAVQWAVDEEIIKGRTNMTIEPKGSATRAEAATLFMQFVELFIK
jgi:hypothetical protein